MMEYRKLTEKEIDPSMLNAFIRTQPVTRCWRKENGKWLIRDVVFTDDWNDDERVLKAAQLRETVRKGGAVIAAFYNGQLKGFAAIEAAPLGSRGQYRDLSKFHVSQDMRRKGIGRELFLRAKNFAREIGGEKLYISAHSAVESQAFYRAMGCVEAQEYEPYHSADEPCDCQMECLL